MMFSRTMSTRSQRLTQAAAALGVAAALTLPVPAQALGAQARPSQPATGTTTPPPVTSSSGGSMPPRTAMPSAVPAQTGGQPAAPTGAGQPAAPAGPAAKGAAVSPDYIIGVDDVLQVVFWREKDLSSEVTVRPDGMISLALINDIRAAGLTTLQLRTGVMDAARKFVTDPSLTITVKTINSRKVYVTGQVNRPGTYPLTDSMTVLQMLAVAGGLVEFASGENVLIMRTEAGQTKSYKFNYKDIRKGKNLQQNIALMPGDTIVVP